MNVRELFAALFDAGHNIVIEDELIKGSATVDGLPVSVVGTVDHAPIGIDLALAQAREILNTVRDFPGRAIVLLVDTQGQRLRHRDELLGINRYMAHLGCCVELARNRGHKVIGLVYDQALSGGFLTSGLMADACYALPEAEIRVMRLPAMARVTKIDPAHLEKLAAANPVFAPGVENYVKMGGIETAWKGDLKKCLREALNQTTTGDHRAEEGLRRGGRTMAAPVIKRVNGNSSA